MKIQASGLRLMRFERPPFKVGHGTLPVGLSKQALKQDQVVFSGALYPSWHAWVNEYPLNVPSDAERKRVMAAVGLNVEDLAHLMANAKHIGYDSDGLDPIWTLAMFLHTDPRAQMVKAKVMGSARDKKTLGHLDETFRQLFVVSSASQIRIPLFHAVAGYFYDGVLNKDRRELVISKPVMPLQDDDRSVNEEDDEDLSSTGARFDDASDESYHADNNDEESDSSKFLPYRDYDPTRGGDDGEEDDDDRLAKSGSRRSFGYTHDELEGWEETDHLDQVAIGRYDDNHGRERHYLKLEVMNGVIRTQAFGDIEDMFNTGLKITNMGRQVRLKVTDSQGNIHILKPQQNDASEGEAYLIPADPERRHPVNVEILGLKHPAYVAIQPRVLPHGRTTKVDWVVRAYPLPNAR